MAQGYRACATLVVEHERLRRRRWGLPHTIVIFLLRASGPHDDSRESGFCLCASSMTAIC